MTDMNEKSQSYIWYKFLLVLIISIGIVLISTKITSYKMFIIIIFMLFAFLGIIILFKKKYLEKVFIIIFFTCIPFFTEINFSERYDFHVNIKEYYTFNYIHILILPFLYITLKNIKKVKVGWDLSILFLFNIICIIGIINAINPSAAFFSYIRFIILTIIYIYISRILDFEKYSNSIYVSLTIGLIIQFIIGIFQKILNGPVGLGILGESVTVFRVSVTGYEKGFSGTFGHPGDFALHALMILTINLFSKRIDRVIRNAGISISTIIIILSAGRSSILIMIFIFSIYYIIEIFRFDVKKFITYISSLMVAIFLCIVFREKLILIINRFAQSDIQKQLESRLTHFSVGFYYIKRNPLLGLGLNNYLDNTYRDFPNKFGTHFSLSNPIHNIFILYAVELGIIGLAIFIVFLISTIKRAQITKRLVDSRTKSLINGCILAIFAWGMYSLQGWASSKTRGLLMLFISCGILANQYYKIRYKKE